MDLEPVVHLAQIWPDANLSDQQVLTLNMHVTLQLMKAAAASGVERVIFASSNHVVGMVEKECAPAIYVKALTASVAHAVERHAEFSENTRPSVGAFAIEKIAAR